MTSLVLLMAGLLSWVLRVGLIVLAPARGLPTRALAVLELAVPAVLSALVVHLLSRGQGATALVRPSAELAALGVATVVAWRTRHVLLVVLAGVLTVAAADLVLR